MIIKNNNKQSNAWVRYGANEGGAAAVEFALIVMPFIIIVVGLFELGLMYTAATVLEGGTATAARVIRTGEAQESADALTTFENALCGSVSRIVDCEDIVYEVINPDNFTDADALEPSFDDDGNLESQGFDPGASSDVVVVRTTLRYQFMTPLLGRMITADELGSVLLMSTVTMRVEPYDFD